VATQHWTANIGEDFSPGSKLNKLIRLLKLDPKIREERGEQGENRKEKGRNNILMRLPEKHHKNKSHLKAF